MRKTKLRTEIGRKGDIKQLIHQVNLKGILYANIHGFSKIRGGNSRVDNVDTALVVSVKRIAYELYYLSSNSGGEISREDLDIILEAVKEAYEKDYCSVDFFEELADWDDFLDQLELELRFCSSKNHQQIGEDYSEALALKAVTDDLNETEIQRQITVFTEEIQRRVRAASRANEEKNLLITELISIMGMSYENDLEMLRNPNKLLSFLLSKIRRACDELYLSNRKILLEEETIRRAIPEALEKYNIPIEKNMAFLIGYFNRTMGMRVMPDLQQIWQALISLYLREVVLEDGAGSFTSVPSAITAKN